MMEPLKKTQIAEVKKKGRYEAGYKYCRRCERFYLTEELRCGVCGTLFRLAPKKKRNGWDPSKLIRA